MATNVIDIQLVHHPIAARIEPFANLPIGSGGGECVFLGRTRQETNLDLGTLIRLDYEAYESMATATLRALAESAAGRFDCLAIRVHHALGEVPPGEVSVLVQVVCAHRDEAFKACRFLIDELKANVPIWKREQWELGSSWAAGQVVKA